MKQTVLTTALLAALWLSSPSVGDPLHKFGTQGAWIHVDSGWQFPKAVGDFTRELQPYNIDGNNDAGVEYRRGSGLQARVEVYAADSAAIGATLDGAKTNAASTAGDNARLASEKNFQVDGLKSASGVKVTYAPEEGSTGAQTNLYYFTTDRWRVQVFASIPDKDADQALDAFVQALPWSTLGADPGLH